MIGNADEAIVALKYHRYRFPKVCQTGANSGEFEGWDWYLGRSRIAWRGPASCVVYKIELWDCGSNFMEHHNASRLRKMDKSWAPDTHLWKIDGESAPILAMTYYEYEVRSREEIPDEAELFLGRDLLENFRRTAKFPIGIVKVVDLGDVIPSLG